MAEQFPRLGPAHDVDSDAAREPRGRRWPLVVLALVAVGVLIGTALLAFRPPASDPNPDPNAAKRVTALPVTCSGTDEIEIRNLTHTGSGTLVDARMKCKVVIVDSQLVSDVPVRVSGEAQVIFQYSKLEGRDAALRVSGRSKVSAAGGAFVGSSAAIVSEGEVELSLQDTRLDAKQVAVRAGSNLRLQLTRTSVVGGEVAVQGGSNVTVRADEAKLRGKRAALDCQASLRADLSRSVLEADAAALRTGLNASIVLAARSRLRAGGTALASDNNLSLKLSDSHVEGGKYGIQTGLNATLQLERGALVRGRTALASDGNLQLNASEATIRGDVVAICSGIRARVEARSSKIEAPQALRLQSEPAKLELLGTTVNGARAFDAFDCDPDSSGRIDPLIPSVMEEPPAPPSKPAPGVEFDYEIAKRELDKATRMASTVCHASPNKGRMAIVDPGFTPDGTNRLATVRNAAEIGGAVECVLHYFKRIRVPPYDPKERLTDIFRVVGLKP